MRWLWGAVLGVEENDWGAEEGYGGKSSFCPMLNEPPGDIEWLFLSRDQAELSQEPVIKHTKFHLWNALAPLFKTAEVGVIAFPLVPSWAGVASASWRPFHSNVIQASWDEQVTAAPLLLDVSRSPTGSKFTCWDNKVEFDLLIKVCKFCWSKSLQRTFKVLLWGDRCRRK